MAYRTGNPTLNDETFASLPRVADSAERMSLQGTVSKSFVLLAIAVAAAAIPWVQFSRDAAGTPFPLYAVGGSLAALVVAIVTTMRKEWSPFLAPTYALTEGLALGAISALLESRFPGIAIQAVGLTFGVFLVLLSAYSSRIVRATENFKLGVVSATGAVALLYLVSIVARWMGYPIPFIHDSSAIGIAFSLFVVGLAAANLVLDFDFIESGVQKGAPRYMEWYSAFGLMVTLFWLYLELLRLLSKSRSR